jgi:type IV secretory pathway VirB10-like protein
MQQLQSPDRTREKSDSELLALATRAGDASARRSPDANANFQDRKIAFADSRADDDIYNPHGIESPASPFQLMAGSLISASLVTGINSDLPGTVIAQVTQPVYDSISGNHLLIPQGSRLIGRYQSEISFGQSRALLVWDRILFPDGRSIRISEPGADTAGAAGLSDRTDNHWNKVLAAAGLATILGMALNSARTMMAWNARSGAGLVTVFPMPVSGSLTGISPSSQRFEFVPAGLSESW